MGRRKTREELSKEALPQPDGVDQGASPSDFTALSDDAQAEFNELFTLLNANSYETVGNYSLTHEQEHGRKLVTVTVALPSTNDWGPATVYENSGDDDE